MALSWNEIKDRALAFSKEWAKAESEDADAKLFLIKRGRNPYSHIKTVRAKRDMQKI